MSGAEKSVTYYPDNALRKGYAALIRDIIAELRANRWLMWQLARRDMLALYKQSFAGIIWTLIVPLVSVGTFIALSRSGIVRSARGNADYFLYGVCGFMFWQFFSVGLISATHSLVKAGSMVIKINISKKSIVFASLSQAIICCGVQVAAVILISFLVQQPVTMWVVLSPLFLIPLIMLTMGGGLLLALLNGIFRDMGFFIALILPFLLLLTPVFYDLPDRGPIAVFSGVNPLYYLISYPRDMLLYGVSNCGRGFWYASLGAFVFFCLCAMVFHLTETRIAERI